MKDKTTVQNGRVTVKKVMNRPRDLLYCIIDRYYIEDGGKIPFGYVVAKQFERQDMLAWYAIMWYFYPFFFVGWHARELWWKLAKALYKKGLLVRHSDGSLCKFWILDLKIWQK